MELRVSSLLHRRGFSHFGLFCAVLRLLESRRVSHVDETRGENPTGHFERLIGQPELSRNGLGVQKPTSGQPGSSWAQLALLPQVELT